MEANSSPYLVVTPVLDDWASLALLVARLDRELARHGLCADVLAVDDGSELAAEEHLKLAPLSAVGTVSILRLRRNLGHQRAIAVALPYVAAHASYDAVVVMDSDGEDRPEDVLQLLEAQRTAASPRVLFGLRSKRSEGLRFRVFYRLYRLMFLVLAGRDTRIGNFSLIPASLLPRVVALPELWNHYAAGMIRSRIPFAALPFERGRRLAGSSRMNFVSLLSHGLSAISVYADVVGSRLITAASAAVGILLMLTLLIAFVRLGTDLAIPGWATMALGFCALGVLQLITMAFMMSILILNSRSNLGYLPLRDYGFFVLDQQTIASRGTAGKNVFQKPLAA